MAYRKAFAMQKKWRDEVVRCINEWAHGGWGANEMTWKNPSTTEWMKQWSTRNQRIISMYHWKNEATTRWTSESMAQRLRQSVRHRADESMSQWLTNVYNHLSNESGNRWSSESLNQEFNESMNQGFEVSLEQWLINDAVFQWVSASMNLPINHWTDESMKQWTNKSINQWVNESVSPWITVN